MIGLFCFVLAVLVSPFKSKVRLEAENAVLRHQLIVLRRTLHGRARLTNYDRWFLVQLYRWFPSILQVHRYARVLVMGSHSFELFGSPHDVIAELARIAEIGDLPAIQIILGHALLGESFELIGLAGGLCAEQSVA